MRRFFMLLVLFVSGFVPVMAQSAVSVRAAASVGARFDEVRYVGERKEGDLTRVTLWRWDHVNPTRFEVWVDSSGQVKRTVDSTPRDNWTGYAHTRSYGVQPFPGTQVGGKLMLKTTDYSVWDGLQDFPSPGNAPLYGVMGQDIGDGHEFEELARWYVWTGNWNPLNTYPPEFQTPNAATPAAEIAWGASNAQDFYRKMLGFDGWWNNGQSVLAVVHAGYRYDNAFFAGGSCPCVFFGDGSLVNGVPTSYYGIGLKNMTDIEIVGHEIAHGYTQMTTNFDYYGHSGGLNEATSDIMGKALAWWVLAGKPAEIPDPPELPGTWEVGKDLLVNQDGRVESLRYMDIPSKDGYSLDYADGYIPQRSDDPHYLSGPLNRWFFYAVRGVPPETDVTNPGRISRLLPEGWPHPLGAHKAAMLWFHGMRRLNYDATYANAAWAVIAQAGAVYGEGSLEQHTARYTMVAIGAIPRSQVEAIVTSISPASASPGDPITLRGGGFYTGSEVFVGGVPAKIIDSTDIFITFAAPDSLGGPVVVENGHGRSYPTVSLAIDQAPKVEWFTASVPAAAPGDPVALDWYVTHAATVAINGKTVPTVGNGVFDEPASGQFVLVATSASGKTATRTITVLARPLDIDGDGRVSIYDALQIVANWGKPGPADLNGDGSADLTDLNYLLSKVR